MSTQLTFSTDQYLQVLDLTYQVAQSLKGKPAADPRLPGRPSFARLSATRGETILPRRNNLLVATRYQSPFAIFGRRGFLL